MRLSLKSSVNRYENKQAQQDNMIIEKVQESFTCGVKVCQKIFKSSIERFFKAKYEELSRLSVKDFQVV